MKPAIMELGGHAPVIVCDDVDPEATAAKSVKSKLRNAGQVCVSPTRFFVQDAIYKKFAAAFAEKAARVKVGDGRDRSEEHTSELQSLMRISYAVFCLKKKNQK